jgi:hypothetical protein
MCEIRVLLGTLLASHCTNLPKHVVSCENLWTVWELLLDDFLFRLLLDPEDGCDLLLRNVC